MTPFFKIPRERLDQMDPNSGKRSTRCTVYRQCEMLLPKRRITPSANPPHELLRSGIAGGLYEPMSSIGRRFDRDSSSVLSVIFAPWRVRGVFPTEQISLIWIKGRSALGHIPQRGWTRYGSSADTRNVVDDNAGFPKGVARLLPVFA
jgi:hypothetical protein